MTPQCGGALALRRQVLGRYNLYRTIENALPHQSGIKSAGRCAAVVLLELFRNAGGPVNIEPEAASGPEQKLRDALDESEIIPCSRMALGKYRVQNRETLPSACSRANRTVAGLPVACASARKAR